MPAVGARVGDAVGFDGAEPLIYILKKPHGTMADLKEMIEG